MPTISGPWAADALIHIKALIVHNIIIYTVYFVYTVLLALLNILFHRWSTLSCQGIIMIQLKF